MKIKKFIAKDIKEGKRLVIEELGDDAVILSNRTVKDANGNSLVEIVAALDEMVQKTKETAKIEKISAESPSSFVNKIHNHNTNSDLVQSGLEEIKSLILELSDSLKYKDTAALGAFFIKLYKKLRNNEVSEDLALKIINRIANLGNIKSLDEAILEARKMLVEGIEIGATLQKNDKASIVLFIGPTGSGKTMSLVKLAIISKLVNNSESIVVSADSQKVGAFEQLETFSSIASIPFYSVYTTSELKSVILANQNKDYIFIDSTGFSYRNSQQISEISNLVKNITPDLLYLTIPATMSELNVQLMLNALKSIKINGVIISKADESESIASILDVIRNNKLTISYITSGVKIPEDIEPAERGRLGQLSIRE